MGEEQHVVLRCWIIKGRMRLRNEQGSALVLVMFLVLMLTILGMAVMGAVIGGAQRTETRENDVQSLHLAEKGLDEATAYIQAQLAAQGAIDPDKLEAVVQSLGELNDSSRNITTELGFISNSASGTIDNIWYTPDAKNASFQSRRYYIDISTSALVNGVKRKLKQRITLDSYPDFLKYAFGSEQTLRLNGAPLLRGNIYAGKQLIVTQTAEYSYQGNALTRQTIYPQILDNYSNVDSGEVYVQSMDSIKYAPEFISEQMLQTVAAGDNQKYKEILGISSDKVKIKEQKKFVQIDVLESFWDKLIESGVILVGAEDRFKQSLDKIKLYSNILNNEDITADLGGPDGLVTLLQDGTRTRSEHIKMPDPYELDPYPPNYTLQEKQKVDEGNAVKVEEYNEQLNKIQTIDKSVIYDGNLLIDTVGYKGINFTNEAKESPKWLVVAGNLAIVNNTDTVMNVKGNILVAGTVTIKGKVAFDSTMFVLGNTVVEDATIQGLNSKELVLISKGKVLINRLDAFSNNPVTMKAFFYTDSTGELYGVGSRFSLDGGFFAKGDLTVNAVVGEVRSLSAQVPNNDFVTQNADGIRRFEVKYNNQLYSHQQSSLPRVSNVSISVGPIKFATE